MPLCLPMSTHMVLSQLQPPPSQITIRWHLQATAVHVGKHAEEIRANWVSHEGKKELEVNCDEFRLGGKNNWASVVDGKPDCFSAQIDRNIVEGLASELSPAFSDTLPEENIALKITVM